MIVEKLNKLFIELLIANKCDDYVKDIKKINTSHVLLDTTQRKINIKKSIFYTYWTVAVIILPQYSRDVTGMWRLRAYCRHISVLNSEILLFANQQTYCQVYCQVSYCHIAVTLPSHCHTGLLSGLLPWGVVGLLPWGVVGLLLWGVVGLLLWGVVGLLLWGVLGLLLQLEAMLKIRRLPNWV